MSDTWPSVPLGEVLTERAETPSSEAIADHEVRIVEKIGFNDGKIQLRADGKTKTKMILIHPGDLVLSGINAAKGAVALYGGENSKPIAATIHYGAYIPREDRVDAGFLWWLLRSNTFRELLAYHLPGGIKTELKAKRLLPIPVPLPPLSEQRRIVGRLEHLAGKIEEARGLQNEIEQDTQRTLFSFHAELSEGAKYKPMADIAPLIRRKVNVVPEGSYPELGVRSFGKGTFVKPTLHGKEVGSKKLYRIEEGDLIFQIVFAWEGAVAVAKPEDAGRVGSHRFLTCVPKQGLATSNYLRYYFLSPEGLEKLGKASPGGAGRNRTLAMKSLAKIEVPAPSFEQQQRFGSLCQKFASAKPYQGGARAELDALLPSILDKAFRGEL